MKLNRIYFDFPVLKTDRLILRQIRQDDVDVIYGYKSESDDTFFPRVERHSHEWETQVFIQRCLQDYYSQFGITWVLCLRDEDSAIGHVRIVSMERSGEVQPHRAEISCALSKAHRRQGLMSEARVRIISFYFQKHSEFIRLHSEVAADNVASLEMNKKLGFQSEGVLRQYEKSGECYHDIVVLSLLRSDYVAHPAYERYRKA